MQKLWVLAWMMVVAASASAAAPVKRIYVFGDSYSDMGRGWKASNGPTAVVYMAQRLGLEMVPSTAKDIAGKSLDFAVSGAVTGSNPGQPVAGGVVKMGMKEQVDEFVAMVKSGTVKFDAASTLFFIAGGLNDFESLPDESAQNLEDEMDTLYANGARRFEVAILPESIPDFSGVADRLNPELLQIPETMQKKLQGAEIATSQWGADFDDVMKHPARYGITDTTNACVPSSGDEKKRCADPASHFYYFDAHPSTAVHKIVGDMLYEELKNF